LIQMLELRTNERSAPRPPAAAEPLIGAAAMKASAVAAQVKGRRRAVSWPSPRLGSCVKRDSWLVSGAEKSLWLIA